MAILEPAATAAFYGEKNCQLSASATGASFRADKHFGEWMWAYKLAVSTACIFSAFLRDRDRTFPLRD